MHFFVVSGGDLAPVLNSGVSLIAEVISIHFFVVSGGHLAPVLNSGVSVIAEVISIHFFVVLGGDLAPVFNSGVSARQELTVLGLPKDLLPSLLERRDTLTIIEYERIKNDSSKPCKTFIPLPVGHPYILYLGQRH